MRSLRRVAAAATFAVASTALAGPDYSNASLWRAAAGETGTIRFTEVVTGISLTDEYIDRGLRFDGTDLTVSGGVFADVSGLLAEDNLVAVEFAYPATALGVDVFGQGVMVLYSGRDMVHTAYFGYAGDGRAFGGVVSSMPFDRALISSHYRGRVQIDDMHWSFVPSPGGLALLVLAGAPAARRRVR